MRAHSLTSDQLEAWTLELLLLLFFIFFSSKSLEISWNQPLKSVTNKKFRPRKQLNNFSSTKLSHLFCHKRFATYFIM